jgi:thiol:disulfide interchange protein DsbD
MPLHWPPDNFTPLHRHYKSWLWLLLACCSFLTPLQAGQLDNHENISPVTPAASATDDFLAVREAYPLSIEILPDRLLLHWHITPGYFLYADKFRLTATSHQQAVGLQISKEQGEITYDDYFQKEVEKFHQDTTVTAVLPAGFSETLLDLSVTYQGCAEAGLCYPPETIPYHVDRNTHTASEIVASSVTMRATNPHDTLPHAAPASFIWMFLFALLGGLILNLMPCVFPVLSIKLLSFANSNQSSSHVREHSWCYTLGVLTTFVLTALLLMLLRQSGAMIGWGYQLQSPWFVAALAIVFMVLALSMSGFIQIGTQWMGVGQQLTDGNHYRHSFFTGVLAVIVASPCSVPFMGVALGYALTQPVYASLVIFLGLGIGLASPFLLFAYWPWLIQHLPKPGAWMETLKHWLALPLYLSSLWLFWVLSHQLIAPTATTSPNTDHVWQPYSAQTLSGYLDAHEPVFVELTADWCITCLVNEKTSLTRPAVADAMKQHHIHYLRGDWTSRDAEITELLKQHQRAGVPLYLYYDANGKLTILPQILSEQTMLDTFHN